MLIMRDSLAETMLTSNINILKTGRTLETTTQKNIMDFVKRIKHCIYDGYRCNILTYGPGGYTSAAGVVVAPPKLLARLPLQIAAPPRQLVYRSLDLKLDKMKYKIVANVLCMMDGFVATDPHFQ